MALPGVEELWSLMVWSRHWVMLEHTVLWKSMIPHCIPSVLGLSGDPSHPTAALGGMFNG